MNEIERLQKENHYLKQLLIKMMHNHPPLTLVK